MRVVYGGKGTCHRQSYTFTPTSIIDFHVSTPHFKPRLFTCRADWLKMFALPEFRLSNPINTLSPHFLLSLLSSPLFLTFQKLSQWLLVSNKFLVTLLVPTPLPTRSASSPLKMWWLSLPCVRPSPVLVRVVSRTPSLKVCDGREGKSCHDD